MTLLLLAGPAATQNMVFDPAMVAQCHAQVTGPVSECIGAASSTCQKLTGGGCSTAGMAGCISRETREWDRLLNGEYRALREQLDRIGDGFGNGPGVDRSDALRDAQRAWLAYRDAECALQYALWQEGTIRSLVGAGCHLDLTATQTMELRAMRREPGQ